MPERSVLIAAAEGDQYLKGLENYLREAGIVTVIAHDGEMALNKARSTKPDLIVSDILIPKLDGFGLCRRIKADPETRGIKILISSALIARERCLEAGADAFLPRAMRRAQLIRTIFGMLGHDIESGIIQGKLQKLSRLRGIIRTMASLLDPTSMLQAVIEQAAWALNASGCAVLLRRGGDCLELGPYVGIDRKVADDFTADMSGDIVGIARTLWGPRALASGFVREVGPYGTMPCGTLEAGSHADAGLYAVGGMVGGASGESGDARGPGDIGDAEDIGGAREISWETLISVPLVDGNGKFIGILVAVTQMERYDAGAEDEDILSALADLLTTAIRVSELHEQIGVEALRRNSIRPDDSEGDSSHRGYRDVISSLYDTVVKQMTDGIVVCDATGRIIQANKAAQRLLGLDAASMSRFTLDAPEIGLTTIDGKSPLRSEFPVNISLETCRRVMGKEFSLKKWGIVIELSTFPLKNEGCKVVGVVAVLRDITQRWELEKMKTNFVSVASHELRTPLTSIRAYAQLILAGRMGHVDEKLRGALEVVSRNVDRMTNIINDILDVARVGEGRLPLNRAEIDLADVAFMAVLEMGPLATNKNINIETQIPHGVIGDWDRQRLHQVFANLLDNAIKFTSPGGKIYVRMRVAGSAVHVEVQDTGRGIDSSELTKIFEPFYQAGRSSASDSESGGGYAHGVGLGLAICKGIIESHGGNIWAESYEGKGTTFHFTLPLKEIRSIDTAKDEDEEDDIAK